MPTIGIRINGLQWKIQQGFFAMRVTVSLLASSLLLCVAADLALAQQAIYQSPSLMPNAALKVAQAALEVCRKNGHPAAVSVNDRAGKALVMLCDRFAGPHTVDTAINKACTALTVMLDTTSFARSREIRRRVGSTSKQLC